MTLFPERHAAVRVLYKAAGQLFDHAADVENSNIGRELCRRRAYECVDLAEKIANMGPVKIIIDDTIQKVEGIPFDLGYVVAVSEADNE